MPSLPTKHRPHRVRERKSWERGFVKQQRLVGRALQARNKRIKLRDEFTCRDCHYVFLEDQLEVDHIIPVAEGGSEGDDNLQSLCIDCHHIKTITENSEAGGLAGLLFPSWLPDLHGRSLTVVAGPPCAGKTTLARQLAKRVGGTVIDADDIASILYNKTVVACSDIQKSEVFRQRNDLIALYLRQPTAHCYLIATCSRPKAREYWTNKGASLIVCNPGAAVCLSRLSQRVLCDGDHDTTTQAIINWR